MRTKIVDLIFIRVNAACDFYDRKLWSKKMAGT